MSTSPPDLTTILTPTLFTQVLSNRLPYPRTGTLNFSSVASYTFYTPSYVSNSFNALVQPPLKALSLHPLPSLLSPDFSFLKFLPAPESLEFPEQALGLQLLLDQGPRSYCRGIDERWAITFFDPLDQKFMKEISSLALANPSLDPRSRKRWIEEVGASHDFWATTWMWFFAPWVHSEHIEDQHQVSTWLQALRLEVEKETGTVDPYREKKDELMKDLWSFPKIFRAGPPKVEKPQGAEEKKLVFKGEGELKKEEFTFWWITLMDVHLPIIERYGRYPYKNRGAGREAREGEVEWNRKAEGFDAVSEEVGKRIKEDIEKGVWTPLGEQ